MNQIDRAIIVASGPSGHRFQPPDGVFVIAVNGVIDWISRADAWFTLDGSPANQRRWNNPRQDVTYYVAADKPTPAWVVRLQRERHPAIVCGWQRYKGNAKRCLEHWRGLGLSDTYGVINSGNSAFGALGLAYQMGAKKAILVGVDGTRERRADGGRPNNLSHLGPLFATATSQVDLVCCGKLDHPGINRMGIAEGVRWLMR